MDTQRFARNAHLRNHLWIVQDGFCNLCGESLGYEGWHADHIIPHSQNGNTEVENLQALCQRCNLIKGTRTVKLRQHQLQLREILRDINFDPSSKTPITIAANVFPGGGKSLYPIITMSELKNLGVKVGWVVPRLSLRSQAAEEFNKTEIRRFFGAGMEIREIEQAQDAKDPSRGTDGFVTTYQALYSADKSARKGKLVNPFLAEFQKHPYVLVLDEVHHLTDQEPNSIESQEAYNWYLAVKPLHELARVVLLISGSAFRHCKTERIAFLDYKQTSDGFEPHFDIEYKYDDARREQAVIPLFFYPMELEEVKYTKNDQEICKTAFENGTDLTVALDTQYGNTILSEGLEHWTEYRQAINSRSKVIIVGASQAHCRKIAKEVKNRNFNYALAISDEKQAHMDIERFRKSPDCNVLITCQMAYEGLNSLQSTHLICLTRIRSLPFLIQMFTRIMRYDRFSDIPYEDQHAFAFVPTDELMMQALSFVHARQPVQQLDDDLSAIFESTDTSGPSVNRPAIIENMSSKAGGFGQQNLEGTVVLSSTVLTKIQLWMTRNKARFPTEIDAYNFLKANNLLSQLEEIPSSDDIIHNSLTDEILQTPKRREADLRNKIQQLTSKADRYFDLDRGTFNKQMYKVFRKSRSEMTEKELNDSYVWLKDAIFRQKEQMK